MRSFLVALLLPAWTCSSPVSRVEDLVNTLAGTDSRFDYSTGNTLPLVARPWGFNHWQVIPVPRLH